MVYSTPWFELIEKQQSEGASPHYSIRTQDYVSVIALTPQKEFILVRQFRPAIGRHTLELPGGHVDAGQTPEEAAAKELLEETGGRAASGRLEFLGQMVSDSGRLENSLWCFLATDVTPVKKEIYQMESGVDVLVYKGGLMALLNEKEFNCALNIAALMQATRRGLLTLTSEAVLP